MADQEIKLKVSAENAAFDVFKQLGGMIDGLQSQVGGAASAMTGFGSAFAGVAAVLGGGAVLSSTVQAFLDMAASTKQLETRFGMTAEAASQMSTQLKLVGMSTDEYTSMAFKLDKQIKSNEAGVNAMGVATRDSNGHLLEQKTLMENASASMMSYAAGTDRNAAAMRLFGKSGNEAMSLLKLNEATLQRAAELTKAYGLTLSDVSLQKAKDYKFAMNEVKLAGESVASHLGEAIVPALTTLAKTFTDVAINVIPLINNGFQLVGTVFSGVADIFKYGVESVGQIFNSLSGIVSSSFGSSMPADFFTWSTAMKLAGTAVTTIVAGMKVAIDTLVFAVQSAGIGISVLGQSAAAAMDGDWTKVTSIVQKGFSDVQAFQNTYSAKMADNAKSVEASMVKIWMSGDKVAESNKKQGKTFDDLSGSQAKAGKSADDITDKYNKQVDAFNALIDTNRAADAELNKLAVSTLTLAQADATLEAAEDALRSIREKSHQLIIQGVTDGVDYKKVQDDEKVAVDNLKTAREADNKVHAESTRVGKEYMTMLRASLAMTGEVVGDEKSIADAIDAERTARNNATYAIQMFGKESQQAKLAMEEWKASSNDLKLAHDALKISTTNVSTAVSDMSAAYTAMTGNSAPKIDKLSSAIQGMTGDLHSTIAVGIAAGNAIGGAFGDAVSKILSVVQAINSVSSALNSISSLSNKAGTALGLINPGPAAGKEAGTAAGGASTLAAIGSVALPLALAGGAIYAISSLFDNSGPSGSAEMGDVNSIISMAKSGNETAAALYARANNSATDLRWLSPSSAEGILPATMTTDTKSGHLFNALEGWANGAGPKAGDDLVAYIAFHDTIAKSINGYAMGGFHPGGLRLVGERGPELEVTGPSRIFSNSDTASMLDNSQVVDALKEVHSLLFALLEMGGDHKVVSERTLEIFNAITQGGTTLRTKAVTA